MKFLLNQNARVDVALLALFVVVWAWYPKIYDFTGDPPGYMRLAYHFDELAEQNMDRHPFPHRVGLLAPHYVSYKLLGVSHVATFLPQLGFLLVMALVALRYCRDLPQKLCAAAALLGLIPWAAVLWPDLGVASFMFLALRFLDRRHGGAMSGALFAVAAFYAFLIKSIAVFIALSYLLVFAVDALRRRRGTASQATMRFHRAAILCGIALIAAYLLAYHLVFGDAFSRFNIINKMGDDHIWAIHGIRAYLRRFTVQPITAFGGLFGIVFLLGLAQAIVAIAKKDESRLVAVYFLAATLFAVFAPTSFSAYQPLPMTVHADGGRHLLFIAPAAAVLAAKLVGGCLSRAYGIAPRALAAACLLAIACQSVMKISRAYDSPGRALDSARRAAARALAENPNAELVLSGTRTHYNFIFYTGFDYGLHSKVHKCDTAPITDPDRDAIVFIDKRLSAFVTRRYGDPNCDKELIALMKAQGVRPRIDNNRVYLAFQNPPPEPSPP